MGRMMTDDPISAEERERRFWEAVRETGKIYAHPDTIADVFSAAPPTSPPRPPFGGIDFIASQYIRPNVFMARSQNNDLAAIRPMTPTLKTKEENDPNATL